MKSINIRLYGRVTQEPVLFLITAMFVPLLTFVTLFVSPVLVRASSCVAFDTNWNLLAFGLNGKDWNAGTQDTWASGMYTR